MVTTFKAIFLLVSIFAILIAPAAQVSAVPIKPVPLTSSQFADTSEIHIKFQENAKVSLQGSSFSSGSGKSLNSLNSLLASLPVERTERLLGVSAAFVDQKRSSAEKKGFVSPDLNSYYRVKLSDKTATQQLLDRLKQLPFVSEAYFAPLPVSAPVSPSYVPQQYYRNDAPRGLGTNTVATLPGALGDNVQITDIEYSWNTQHEDISDARQADAFIPNGTTPNDPFANTDHGTAVTGILNADHNGIGIDGIAPNAKLRMINAYSLDRGWDLANALLLAQENSSPGDIVLIEQQARGPNGEYLPVEWIPAVYDAIKLLTQNGLIVIEAAGNGSANLDDPLYGSPFPQGKPDSGAIMVGAGAPSCEVGFVSTPHRAALSFSNYGSRVNVQSWGKNVTTTGYRSSPQTQDTAYTTTFSGTSSASALVAGAVASITSSKEAITGTPPTPQEIRNLLLQTGNPGDTRVINLPIGVAPNMPRALGLGTSSLSTPCVSLKVNSYTSIILSWDSSVDNKDASFDIRRGGALIAQTTSTSYTDSSVPANAISTYSVTATNAAGEASGTSTVTISTIDSTPPTASPYIAVTDRQMSEISLGWNASADEVGVAGYDVYRNSTYVGTTHLITYTDTGLKAGTSYSYYVIAFDAAGNRSAASSTVSSTTLTDTIAPSAPTGLSGTTPTTTRVSLKWTAATDNLGVVKYNIYRDAVLIGTSTTVNYTDNAVARKKTYAYQVKAVDAAGNISSPSNSVSIRTK